MKGEVQSISPTGVVTIKLDSGEVCNFKLAPVVKLSYIKPGRVSFSTSKEDSGLITYITSDNLATRQVHSQFNPYGGTPKPAFNGYQKNDESILKQFSLREAIAYFQLNRAELKGVVTLPVVEAMAKDIYNIIKKEWNQNGGAN